MNVTHSDSGSHSLGPIVPSSLVSTVLHVTPKPDVKIIQNLGIFIARTLADKTGVAKARELNVQLGPDEVFTVQLNDITWEMRNACVAALREDGYGVTDIPHFKVVTDEEGEQEEVA